MFTYLVARRTRATTIIITGALLIAVLAGADPATARATSLPVGAPLSEGSGMAGQPSARTLLVQRALRARGYHLGAPGVDGRFGPLTAAAVRRFQARAGLAVDGIVGIRTARALDLASSAPLREGIGMGPHPSVRVHRLQRALIRSGFDVGRAGADGRFGPMTAAAVRHMQHAHRVTADGIVGPQTRRIVLRLTRVALAQPTAASNGPTPRARNLTRRGDRLDTSATPGPTRTSEKASTARWWLFALLATVCAAAAATAMRLLSRRPRKRVARVVPIQRDLYLEARSSADGVVAVRGFVLAAELTPEVGMDDVVARYLVDDPLYPAPVWVRADDVTRPASGLVADDRVIGYVAVADHAGDHRTSRTDSAVRGLEELCAARGWELQIVVDDATRKNLLDRPGMRHALTEICAGRARGLVINDSASLANPLRDIPTLFERLREADAALVVGDLDLDTTTPTGRATASTLALLDDEERDRARRPADVPRPRTGETVRGRP